MSQINESLPSLQSQGIERLTGAAEVGARGRDAASSAWTAEQAHGLTSIAKSILLNFLELVGILSLDAAQYAPKIDHFNALFFNAHHLINEYRPHQARETLIAMMEEQLAAEEAEIAAIQSMNGRLNEVLRKLATKEAKRTRHAESAVQSGAGERRPTLAGHRPAWLALEQELGSV